mgnify:CR=1 FL=1
MAIQRSQPGFTLIELVIVLAVIATLAAIAVPELTRITVQADAVDVQTQAKTLRTRNLANEIACQSGSASCIRITDSGPDACKEAIKRFLPEFAGSEFEDGDYKVTNIDSNEPRSDWQAELDDQIESGAVSEPAAIYSITRDKQGLIDKNGEDWLETWNVEQPCILYIED